MPVLVNRGGVDAGFLLHLTRSRLRPGLISSLGRLAGDLDGGRVVRQELPHQALLRRKGRATKTPAEMSGDDISLYREIINQWMDRSKPVWAEDGPALPRLGWPSKKSQVACWFRGKKSSTAERERARAQRPHLSGVEDALLMEILEQRDRLRS